MWHYLREHPQCATPALKEVHFFDGNPRRLVGLLDETERALAEARTADDRAFLQEKSVFVRRAIGFAGNDQRTAESFEALLASVAVPGTKVVAELTPANGSLRLGTLKELANLPVSPKFVMILRDPVDRMWSQIRMAARKRGSDANHTQAIAFNLLDRFIAGEEGAVSNRHDYAGMLQRARRAIPADRLFVDFFETFINQTRIDQFCDFLGVDHLSAKLTEPRAVGAHIPLPSEDQIRLRKRLNFQYEAVKRELGDLPDAWLRL